MMVDNGETFQMDDEIEGESPDGHRLYRLLPLRLTLITVVVSNRHRAKLRLYHGLECRGLSLTRRNTLEFREWLPAMRLAATPLTGHHIVIEPVEEVDEGTVGLAELLLPGGECFHTVIITL